MRLARVGAIVSSGWAPPLLGARSRLLRLPPSLPSSHPFVRSMSELVTEAKPVAEEVAEVKPAGSEGVSAPREGGEAERTVVVATSVSGVEGRMKHSILGEKYDEVIPLFEKLIDAELKPTQKILNFYVEAKAVLSGAKEGLEAMNVSTRLLGATPLPVRCSSLTRRTADAGASLAVSGSESEWGDVLRAHRLVREIKGQLYREATLRLDDGFGHPAVAPRLHLSDEGPPGVRRVHCSGPVLQRDASSVAFSAEQHVPRVHLPMHGRRRRRASL